MPVKWFARSPAILSGVISLLVLVMAFVLDGSLLHCNDYVFAICTGFSVPWLALSAVLFATLAGAILTSALPEQLYMRWKPVVAVALGAGCLASCILVLQTGAVPR